MWNIIGKKMSGGSTKYYARACKITKFIPNWERDKNEMKSKIEKEKEHSKYLEQIINKLKPNFLKNKFWELALEVDQIDDYCDSMKANSPTTLLIFNWDTMCPFFNIQYDSEHFSFKQLKQALEIDNDEAMSLENDRSSSVFYLQKQKPRLAEEKYFELGSFIHMNKRNKAHIGLCINNVENTPSIEYNKLNQYYMESAEMSSDNYPSRKIQLLQKDTTLERSKLSKESFREALTNMWLHSSEDDNFPYENVFYFVNPVLNQTDTSVVAIKEQIKLMILKYIQNSLQENSALTVPNFYLISTHIKTGYSCVEYYSPKKTLANYAVTKVIFYYYFYNGIIFLKINFLI